MIVCCVDVSEFFGNLVGIYMCELLKSVYVMLKDVWLLVVDMFVCFVFFVIVRCGLDDE